MLLNNLAAELSRSSLSKSLKMNQGLTDISTLGPNIPSHLPQCGLTDQPIHVSTLGPTTLSYLPHCGLTSQLIIPGWQDFYVGLSSEGLLYHGCLKGQTQLMDQPIRVVFCRNRFENSGQWKEQQNFRMHLPITISI